MHTLSLLGSQVLPPLTYPILLGRQICPSPPFRHLLRYYHRPYRTDQHWFHRCLQCHRLPHHRRPFSLLPLPHPPYDPQACQGRTGAHGALDPWQVRPTLQHHRSLLPRHLNPFLVLPTCPASDASHDELVMCRVWGRCHYWIGVLRAFGEKCVSRADY